MDQLLEILSKPDNIPIILLLVSVVFYSQLAWSKARKNDNQGVPDEAKQDDKVQVWPYLVRVEFLATILIMAVLVIWSIALDAPLEEPANRALTPNPSKAPWYFLGLQEMLVYFDPWIAGVVLPTLIIVGLMAIPYIDINEKGNGYYTFKERKFAVLTYVFGFHVLWVLLIVIGTLFRGPGWNFFWPWETWDPHFVGVLTNVDLSEYFGIPTRNPDNTLNPAAMIFGAVCVGALYTPVGLVWIQRQNSDLFKKLGFIRYSVVAFLLLSMVGLVIKILLRLGPPVFGLNPVKYVLVTPWFNI
ncbi:MAG: cytochrome C [Ignavibacteria bacterium GWA2_55_11]|nr:MAG: cytochrome C [Ignavibacteria bacterium GWA2_55_11]OGU47535.1 MAG: cytochrome C [Ignavibacteria bacterium GWC2_56_12]OGU67654.1 MAG: cytochrome C [Ignavibacteria bacterium RIFCSPHIGHO2_02_FULL_56_12]OGU70121.1 MAG: cytochrome C [Ignavibacteria bacterium RIFCSPLOWO2_02_FULL_55_14]OGU73432.1 MAG: cytochrome C [Ignavibacteria bacterium RIFCSPLOWO2_12_FULL_56_21]